jgi:hypothetical protein
MFCWQNGQRASSPTGKAAVGVLALELFKSHFCAAAGRTHWRSSGLRFAGDDLRRDAELSAVNAPLFIEAFFDACRAFEAVASDRFAPDEAIINKALATHHVGFAIRGDRLELTGEAAALISIDPSVPTLAEQSVAVIDQSLNRASDLLHQGKYREAVQESLWLLETVATAFRGLDTQNGSIEGRYFNQIVRDLRNSYRGAVLDRALEWAVSVHGFLSSPTGGGVRHGLDLREGIEINENQSRLFCNLIRSFVGFLLVEHERMVSRR